MNSQNALLSNSLNWFIVVFIMIFIPKHTTAQTLDLPPPTGFSVNYIQGFDRAQITYNGVSGSCETIEIRYSQNRVDLENLKGRVKEVSCKGEKYTFENLTPGKWYFALKRRWLESVCYEYRGEEECDDEDFDSEQTSIISIDVTINITETVISDFENGLGGFQNITSNSWSVRSGTTSSSNTGPSRAIQGSNYAYMETSSCCAFYNGDIAIIDAASIGSLSSNDYLIFNFSMYGADIGELALQVKVSNVWETIWSKHGAQHTNGNGIWGWTETMVQLTDSQGLRFVGTAAGGFKGDIAIDNVRLIKLRNSSSNRRVTYIHTDLLGSPVANTDENGNVIN